MSLLVTAIKSHIPLVAVSTRDTVYVETVLKNLLPAKANVTRTKGDLEPTAHCVHYVVLDEKTDLDDVKTYQRYADKHGTLVIVNPPKMRNGYLNCGELPVPKGLLKSTLNAYVKADHLDNIILSLGGCTIKEAVELSMLTMGAEGAITPEGITKTRKSFFSGSKGLSQIDLTQLFYQPMAPLQEWTAKKKALFFNPVDPRLMPRGVLFKGTPGTGKTQGAKFIAKTWGIPLYRMDIAGAKSKWVGEASNNLIAGLARVDAEEPCVVLLDEVEKVFAKGEHSDAGTTTDMLSQVLWWLAEHRTRVLVVMTTNDEKKLPPELYREGRIDRPFTFEGLTIEEAEPFLEGLVQTYKIPKLPVDDIVEHVMETAYKEEPTGRVSHAALTEGVNDAIATIITASAK